MSTVEFFNGNQPASPETALDLHDLSLFFVIGHFGWSVVINGYQKILLKGQFRFSSLFLSGDSLLRLFSGVANRESPAAASASDRCSAPSQPRRVTKSRTRGMTQVPGMRVSPALPPRTPAIFPKRRLT
ncbi:hypothetical protein [Burkholderia sp. Nafp2/4-1b]|uniref:hypothetical protein n=1 Tax=Burkholderia sp. Nafp2/4-1b TaxID=2116686 RepID=UPI0013CE7222|nr:hypothetical protein [Burkholderia sp. Nafp2/4-1b]